MNILRPIISVYVLPIFLAYFFSGVYYIISDVSKPVDDRPKYLSNPVYINLVGVLWLYVLMRSAWRRWHHQDHRDFYRYLRKEAIPKLAVFSLLAVDFDYACSRWL